ncbi:hypothetical protein RvY_13140 [Ramazzottius varieornatus]|uniref:WAP domain-containing protein n=1 Tax=Ramazzottius varieornatus TaxID=947166 RepID=A0A1D1VLX6_RAMVA|nr:hypothetical protein RvY_13140 [Ramazzottius varieornatus]
MMSNVIYPSVFVVAFFITEGSCASGHSTINPHGTRLGSTFRNMTVSLSHSSTSTSASTSSSTSTSTSSKSTSRSTSTIPSTPLSSTTRARARPRTRSTTIQAAVRSFSEETIVPQLFKAGICPVSTSTFGDCTVSCVSDSSCRGTRKCCLINGCGLKCLQPINQSSAANPEVRILGQDLLNADGTSRKQFTSPFRMKLASRSDSTSGSRTYKAEACPKVTLNPSAGRCVQNECSPSHGDSECPGSRKCCTSHDGTCMICTDVADESMEALSPAPRS